MNLHINGIEMRTVELAIEYVKARKLKGVRQKAFYRGTIKGDRAALNRILKDQPAKLVLERDVDDPRLSRAFAAGLEVRIRSHKFRVYRRDRYWNKVWLKAVD